MKYPQTQLIRTFCIGHLDKSLLSKLTPKDREITTSDNPEGAIEVCSTLIDRHPENASVYLCRGNAYSDLNRFTEAISDFNAGINVISLNSGTELSIRLYHGRSYVLTSERRFDEALADLGKLIIISEETETKSAQTNDFLDCFKAYAHTQRGYIYSSLWKLEQSVAESTYVIESFRPRLRNPAHNYRAHALIFLERFDEAEKDCREALSHGAGNYEFVTRTNLAWLLLRRKDYDSAASEIMQTLKADIQHPLTKTNLGDLFLGLNCRESAKEQYADVSNHIYENGCVDIDDYLVAIHATKRLSDLNMRRYEPDYQKEAAENGFIPLEMSDRYLKAIHR